MGGILTATPTVPGGKPTSANGPGSNGYWRRQMFFLPGTYVWKAKKAGKVKIEGIGAAAGGSGTWPGPSGSYGEREILVAVGDELTVIIGSGGGGVSSGPGGNGGSTSVSGSPIGAVPLVLVGAIGASAAGGTPGTSTGPWDKTYAGASSASANKGSPSSASPLGAGIASTGQGGAGWGGAGDSGGGSTLRAASGNDGAPGLFAKGGLYSLTPNGEALPFWDLADCDSGGGAVSSSGSEPKVGGSAGPGAGGAAGNTYSPGGKGGVSVLGGGTGLSRSGTPERSGFGGGGGASLNTTAGDG